MPGVLCRAKPTLRGLPQTDEGHTKYEVYILVLDVPCMILHCRTRLLSRAELMSATQGMWDKKVDVWYGLKIKLKKKC